MMNRTVTTAKRVLLGVLVVALLVVVAPASPISERLVAHADAGDWTMYLGDIGRTSFNSSEAILNAGSAERLHLNWSAKAGGAISVQPIVANNLVYWAGWDCYERASDLHGNQVWATYLTSTQCGGSGRITSTPTVATISINGVDRSVLFVPEDNVVYAIDALAGAIIWQTSLVTVGPVWASPLVYNGSVYIGLPHGLNRVGGQLVQLNAATGTILHRMYSAPTGCVGAGQWGSDSVDPATGIIYFATGDAMGCPGSTGAWPPYPYAQAVIAVNASGLSVVGAWQVPDWQAKLIGDLDFGNTPTFFNATIGGTPHGMIGVSSKDGVYYAFDRSNISQGPVWERRIAISGSSPRASQGSISPSASDGSSLYIGGGATTVNNVTCPGSLRSVDPSSGAALWTVCMADGPVLGAVTLFAGLVEVGEGDHLKVLDASTGNTLFDYATSSGQWFWGAATVSNGVLYQGDSSGTLYAFSPGGVGPSMAASPSAAAYPTHPAVEGFGFNPGQQVNLYWDHPTGTPIATSIASAAGSTTTSFAVPDVPGGSHVLYGVQQGGTPVSIPFQLTPQATLNKSVGSPDVPNTVTGHGFHASETVRMYWENKSGTPVATAIANGNGDFSGIQFTMPSAVVGMYRVWAVGSSGSQTLVHFIVKPGTTLSPTSASSGQSVSLSGQGFGPGEAVTLYWNCASLPCSASSSVIGTATTASNGSFSKTFSVPAGAVSGTKYPITTQGESTGIFATSKLQIQ